jgi:hypothetical protein
LKPEAYAVVDGDTRNRGDYRKIKNALCVANDHILELPELNLEAYVADITAIRQAFPTITASNTEISEHLRDKSGIELKRSLNRVLCEVGGYAALIAANVPTPQTLLEFLKKIDFSHTKLP